MRGSTHDRGLLAPGKRFNNFAQLIENMVARDGVEPPTPALSGKDSGGALLLRTGLFHL
jgi:hypothetical protein